MLNAGGLLMLLQFAASLGVAAFDVAGVNSQPNSSGTFSLSDVPADTESITLVQIPNISWTTLSLNRTSISWSSQLPSGWHTLLANPSATVCVSLVYLHDGISLISGLGTTKYSVAGKQTILVSGSGFYASSHVLFRFQDESQTVYQAGTVDATAGTVSTTTPAWQVPSDWYSSCKTPSDPESSSTCVPDLVASVAVSLDGGTTFSTPLSITFGWIKPLKLAWAYYGPVTDFGWTYAVNRGRMEVEGVHGGLVDATTYIENLPEGELVAEQENKGATLLTNTLVPEYFGASNASVNDYFPAFSELKKYCDEDYDLVFTTSYGFMSQTIDVSSGYQPCTVGAAGGAHATHFVHASGFLTNALTSTVFGKIYQMRYLTGLVAGDALAAPVGSPYATARGKKCVGYVAAFPIPEVQRGINAFALGCKARYSGCIVKVIWSGAWHSIEKEGAAAHFLWNVGECDIITQHSDTPTPQLIFKDYGGVGIGYNSNMRELVGDSVLTAPMLEWGPMWKIFTDQLLAGTWQQGLQAWPGAAEGAVTLMPTFSPKVDSNTVELVEREHDTLKAATGDSAFHHIFCGPLHKRWAYDYADPAALSGPRATGCGGQPIWRRLDPPEQINLKHYADKDGLPLPTSLTVPRETDCLWGIAFPGQALLQTAFPAGAFDEDDVFNDYMLDGVELFEEAITPFGTVFNQTTHPCTSGDRFFEVPAVVAYCAETGCGKYAYCPETTGALCVCKDGTEPGLTFETDRACILSIASAEQQRIFWSLSFFCFGIGFILSMVVINEFVRNPALRNGARRAFVAIALPDFVLTTVYYFFHFFNLIRGSKTEGVTCTLFAFLTSGIIFSTFCGPPIVAIETYFTLTSTRPGGHRMSRSQTAIVITVPFFAGFGIALAAYSEDKLGDYRGLLCYNEEWDSFSTGGVTLYVFIGATAITLAAYAVAAVVARTRFNAAGRTSMANKVVKSVFNRGLALVATFFISHVLFVIAVVIPYTGGIPDLTFEMVASLVISTTPIVDAVILLQTPQVRSAMLKRLFEQFAEDGDHASTSPRGRHSSVAYRGDRDSSTTEICRTSSDTTRTSVFSRRQSAFNRAPRCGSIFVSRAYHKRSTVSPMSTPGNTPTAWGESDNISK